MFPLYYGELPNGIAISTAVQGVLEAGVSREIDVVGVQTLFGLGFNIGSYTAFRAVKAFPVGGELVWEPGRLRVTENYPEIKPNLLSRSDAIDGYLELFGCAMRRRVIDGAPIYLPLSGGRDSRHILLELVRLGSPPARCFTSSFLTMRNDVITARALCEKLGVPHVESEVPEDVVGTELEKNEQICFEATEHGWTWALAKSMANPDAVSYDGIDGDVLSAGHFHDDENSRLYRAGRFDEIAQRIAPHPHLRVSPAGIEAPKSDVYQRVVTELLRYKNTHNPMMFFFLYNRSRRAVSITISGLFGAVLRAAYAPYLDRGVFDFLAGLPEEMFIDRMVHTEAIARRYPESAEIPFAKKTPTPKSILKRYAWQGFRFSMRVPSSEVLERRAASLRFLKALAMSGYLDEAPGILYPAVMLHQLGQLQRG
jgi:hypothetical protein